MLIRNKKGQNTAEYAILIGLVVAALLAMQLYVKRGLQGHVARTVDTELGEQFEPQYYTSTINATRTTNEKEEVTGEGTGVTRTLDQDTSNRSGSQTYSGQ